MLRVVPACAFPFLSLLSPYSTSTSAPSVFLPCRPSPPRLPSRPSSVLVPPPPLSTSVAATSLSLPGRRLGASPSLPLPPPPAPPLRPFSAVAAPSISRAERSNAMLRLCRLTSSLFPPPLPSLGASRCRRGRRRLLSALPSPSPTLRSQRVSTAPLEHEPGPATSHEQPRRDPALAHAPSTTSSARSTPSPTSRTSSARHQAVGFWVHSNPARCSCSDASSRPARSTCSARSLIGPPEATSTTATGPVAGARCRRRCTAWLVWSGSGARKEWWRTRRGTGRWSCSSGQQLLKFLDDIEELYDCIGGIIGYQIMALELPSTSKDRKHRPSKDKFIDFHVPNGLNLLEDTEYASQAALWGIENFESEKVEKKSGKRGDDSKKQTQETRFRLTQKSNYPAYSYSFEIVAWIFFKWNISGKETCDFARNSSVSYGSD